LQQSGWGIGNYTEERKQWLNSVNRQEFWQDIQRLRDKNN